MTDAGEARAARGKITLTRDHAWPVGITIALLIVIAVNVAFIVIAVTGQDEVAPSYTEGER